MRNLDRFRGAPDPEDALRRYERLAAAGLPEPDDEDLAEVVWTACAVAPYLAMLGARDVGRLLGAARDPHLHREKPREVMVDEVLPHIVDARDEGDLGRRLRDYRAREYVRLGVRECGLGDREAVGRELAHLADVLVDAALRWHDAELGRAHGEPRYDAEDGTSRRAELVVFGMGKLGGEELNFASDIDVLYVYSSDNGAAGDVTLHEYFDKLARRVTRTIGEVTEDDVVFRVDLRLRPEGSRGPLVNSLPSIERYYESWGRPWERQAWLKARPSAGDPALGREVLAALEPFVHPRTTGPHVVGEVEELNRRIKAELDGVGLGGGFDVKVGRGGIREIEFFVQALQLVHAGKQPQLRERSTRRALDKLLFAGLVAERERRALADAYELLRHVEHLVQLESGRQNHRLPTDFHALTVLARRLHCADAGELASVLGRHTAAVAEIFDTLGAPAPIRPEVAVLLAPAQGGEGVPEALAALGFRDVPAAAHELELLRRLPEPPPPALVEELAASPDPDQALRFAVDFAARTRGWQGLWRLLDQNRPLLRLLASLFGTSAFLARSFVEHPELLDTLVLAGDRGEPLGADDAARAGPEDGEAAWNAIRKVKTEELLRVGLADIAGELDELEVCARLSDLADFCLARTFDVVRATLARRQGEPGALAPMAVLALGKHGARELGYAGDLDLVFVYDGGLDDHEAMTKLAQRLVNALGATLEEGRLYVVDTRLRPSGQRGTLVSSLAAWRQYHAREGGAAQLWERQALIKLRAVAGDRDLGAKVEREAAQAVYGGPAPPAAAVADAILRMRERIEKELARETGGSYDIKAGRGGLVDVEFAAQYLQLVYGPTHPTLRVRGTLDALERAAAAAVIDEATRATLCGGYRFLRRLEHRMRIVHDRPIHELPGDPVELDKLARRTGFPSATTLSRAYLAWTRDVRACYLRLLGS